MDLRSDRGWRLDLGARPIGSSVVQFRVWAPRAKTVSVHVCDPSRNPVPMDLREYGYFEVTVEDVRAGDRYHYILDGEKVRPDPASRSQPDGVHQASAVVDPDAFGWTDRGWRGLPLKDLIIYELHTGTFTETGTFDTIIPHLDYLKHEVGITAIELMPVAQFPGTRNWGYDGTYLYAPHSTYGGPQGLKTLVDACHAAGLAVILDVVYNHLGPEGNYLADFGPYFTDRYRTPWGAAVNYDGPDSDEVRHFIVGNALYWVTEYHIDGLRLDAIHGIYDFSANHILRELAEAVHGQAARLERQIFVIAESALNDARMITAPAQGGYGLDGQWNDDFHHALRTVLTKERAGYYQDYEGLGHLATAMKDGFVYSGQYSRYHRRRHGNPSKHCAPSQFVVFSQNHDQVGNRAFGDRLSSRIPFEALKVAAAAVLLSPNIPLLFMGEEYGETAPFLYFIDHGDPALVEAVRRGRRAEFASFAWREDIPDPQDPATFERSRIQLGSPRDPRQAAMLRWTRRLIDLRTDIPSLGAGGETPGHQVWVYERENVLVVHRWAKQGPVALLVLGFNSETTSVMLREPGGRWSLRLDSCARDFGGTGQEPMSRDLAITAEGVSISIPAHTVALYLRVD
ncbi:MAG: malto-oligosyltrehalose trehalohydrolase [Nitrospirae bacterium]|nr:malto-oligosyltrehalose trehalohydrolase [Nitrospirota bacterium]